MAVIAAKWGGKCVKCGLPYAKDAKIGWAGKGTAMHYPVCPKPQEEHDGHGGPLPATGYYASGEPLPGNGTMGTPPVGDEIPF